MRRHLAATPLLKGIPNFRPTRIALLRAETQEELFKLLDQVEERITMDNCSASRGQKPSSLGLC